MHINVNVNQTCFYIGTSKYHFFPMKTESCKLLFSHGQNLEGHVTLTQNQWKSIDREKRYCKACTD